MRKIGEEGVENKREKTICLPAHLSYLLTYKFILGLFMFGSKLHIYLFFIL